MQYKIAVQLTMLLVILPTALGAGAVLWAAPFLDRLHQGRLRAAFADLFAHYPAERRIATELAARIDAVTIGYGWPSVLSEPASAT